MGKVVVLTQNHPIWSKFGTCISIPRNKYWGIFISKNQPRIQNGRRGGFPCKIMHLRRIWTKLGTCIFHPPETKLGVILYRKINPGSKMGEGVGFYANSCISDGYSSNLAHVFSIPRKHIDKPALVAKVERVKTKNGVILTQNIPLETPGILLVVGLNKKVTFV